MAQHLVRTLRAGDYHAGGPQQTYGYIEVAGEDLQIKFCYAVSSPVGDSDAVATYAQPRTDGTEYFLYAVRVLGAQSDDPAINVHDLITALGYKAPTTQHNNFARGMRKAYSDELRTGAGLVWFRGAYTFIHSAAMHAGPGISIRGCALIFNQCKVSKIASSERVSAIRRELATVMGIDESRFFLSSEKDIIRMPHVATNVKDYIQKVTVCFPSHLEFVVSSGIRVDLYYPAGIVVEIDEHGHQGYKKGAELDRELYIKNHAHEVFHHRPGYTTVLRFNPDSADADLALFCGKLVGLLHAQSLQTVKDDLHYERSLRTALEESAVHSSAGCQINSGGSHISTTVSATASSESSIGTELRDAATPSTSAAAAAAAVGNGGGGFDSCWSADSSPKSGDTTTPESLRQTTSRPTTPTSPSASVPAPASRVTGFLPGNRSSGPSSSSNGLKS